MSSRKSRAITPALLAACRATIKLASAARITHGHTRGRRKSGAYKSWLSMRVRTMDPKHKHWHRYGGRGIRIDPRWLGRDGFANFLADLGERPAGMTLDRKDNDGHYEPGNCRWATRAEQANNSRLTLFVEWDGQRLPIGEWAKRLGMPKRTLLSRVRNWPLERAMTERSA